MVITNSSRLSFHLIDETDKDFLFQLDQDPQVMKYLNGGKPTSKDVIENTFIPRLNAYRNKEKGWGLWKVTITETQQDIGWILVRPMDFFSDAPNLHDLELGWRFMKNSWGKGYATEAAIHIKNILSLQSEIKHFSATALIDNIGSISIMKKLGMTHIKTYLHSDNELGETEAVLYRLTI
ncbi:GNAT family N-acetyltransferase [Pseudocolwellia sp. HL-MZ7]|uniref:GNAT family N-acetyltransferase n=1 Tax=Pseudocolwellia sp. HL-MZ7 TaxID=3400627 RepID=UPI003CEA3958